MKSKFSRVQIVVILLLTLFYFSYMLLPNQDPTGQVRGVYYGAYVWPVGVWLFRLFGSVGWSLFGAGMIIWFWYSLPLYILLHEILGIQIPFTASPSITGEYALAWWGWIIMFVVVVLYNFLIAYGLPYVKGLVIFFFKSADKMSFSESVHQGHSENYKARGFNEG